MSLLTLNQRPLVVFDAANAEHRRAAHQFMKDRSWGTARFRFAIDDESTNLVDMMNRRLLEWYMSKEFNRESKKAA